MSVDEMSEHTAVEESEVAPAPGSPGVARAGPIVVSYPVEEPHAHGVLLAAASFASVLYFTSFRPSQQTDAAAEQVAIDSASTATVTLLSTRRTRWIATCSGRRR